MTTATIAKRGSTTATACVAMISKHGPMGLAAHAEHSGHHVSTYATWGEWSQDTNNLWDLVVIDDTIVAETPTALNATVVLVTNAASAQASDRYLATLPAGAGDAVLASMLEVLIELQVALRRCHELEGIVGTVQSGSALVGNSPVMRRLHGSLCRAADGEGVVLIEGPAGAGKTLAARVVHCKSRRASHVPMFADASTVDADRLAALFQEAATTTLVLENIETMPANGQAALVRHIKESASNRTRALPRVVTTSSAHLPELVARGSLREDLYYRLHAYPIVVPALRERVDDIVLIAEAILTSAALGTGNTPQRLSADAAALLTTMAWPSNVAQLEAVVRRAAVQAGGGTIERHHLLAPATVVETPTATAPAPVVRSRDDEELTEAAIRPFELEEQELLSRALRATKGNVRRAAQLLGIGRATLYRKIQQYRLRLQ